MKRENFSLIGTIVLVGALLLALHQRLVAMPDVSAAIAYFLVGGIVMLLTWGFGPRIIDFLREKPQHDAAITGALGREAIGGLYESLYRFLNSWNIIRSLMMERELRSPGEIKHISDLIKSQATKMRSLKLKGMDEILGSADAVANNMAQLGVGILTTFSKNRIIGLVLDEEMEPLINIGDNLYNDVQELAAKVDGFLSSS